MNVVKRENLTVVTRTYTDKQGQEKKVWKTIGEITTFEGDDGSKFQSAELYTMPGVRISVFEQKEKGTQETAPQPKQNDPIDDLPF